MTKLRQFHHLRLGNCLINVRCVCSRDKLKRKLANNAHNITY